MRGLLGAALFAPVLVAGVVVPHGDFDQDRDVVNKHSIDRTFAHIGLPIPSDTRSADIEEENFLVLGLEVLASEKACGYGNVTIDGTVLPQTLHDDYSTGKGLIKTFSKSVVAASWSFHCVKVNGVADAQMMKFVVDLIDGKAVQDVGFSALFRQSGLTEIVNIETDLSVPDQIVANPNPEGLQIAGEEPLYTLEEEIAELDYLRSQLREIRYLIHEKERAITHQNHRHHNNAMKADIKNCDSLKCVAKALADHARHAAHSLYGMIRDGDEDFEELGKPHFKHPKFPHKHGNHTHGNHTHPPPWKRPHHHPLPICRFPPPPHHGPRPPFHHGPPPHGPPHRGPGDSFDHHGPPPPHHRKPEHGAHGKPPGDDFDDFPHDGPEYPPPPPHHGPPPPDFDDDFPHDAPGDDRPHPPPHHMPPPPDFDHPPPHHDGPHHEPPPPEFDHDQERIQGDFGPPHLPHHEGPPPFRPRHNNVGRALQIIKFTSIGFLFAFLILTLHRRVCTPKRRADRQARREERNRRRAYRRAAHKHLITRILGRISGHDGGDEEEEKRWMEEEAEDGMSTTMSEDITQLRNAADVVGDLVSESSFSPAASDVPLLTPATTPSHTTSTPPLSIPSSTHQDFEIGSQIGDEDLPAYEDNDGSEMSSVIADGFRYTPGSSEYSPSASREGSVHDILGPDTKS